SSAEGYPNTGPLIIIILLIILIAILPSCLCVPTLALMRKVFDPEKLDVYQDSILFVCWVDELLREIPKTLAVHNQLNRASTSTD
ncbi:MAG: four helix bundle protein, partial [Lentisphaerota bacterium]